MKTRLGISGIKPSLRTGSSSLPRTVALVLLTCVLQACAAADPTSLFDTTDDAAPGEENSRAAEDDPGFRLPLHHSNFFSLTHPHSSASCAGDSLQFFDPIAMGNTGLSTLSELGGTASSYSGPDPYVADNSSSGPVAYGSGYPDSSISAKPGFIKNVSVDLTDANADVSANQALSCSWGTSNSTPAASNCASFDYGAVGGIPASLGGTFLLVGGVHGSFDSTGSEITNTSNNGSCGRAESGNYHNCDTTLFALGVDTLPKTAAGSTLAPGITDATEAISMWSDLTSGTGYTGPKGTAGAAIALNPELKQIVLFGGSSPLSSSDPTGPASETYQTWVYDLKKKEWTDFTGTPTFGEAMTTLLDYNGSTTSEFSKVPTNRSLFGYAALPWTALSKFSTTGNVTTSEIDTSDRIAILGGLLSTWETSTTPAVSTNLYKFNPTFGPELRDSMRTAAGGLQAANTLVQWVDSFPITLMNNGTAGSPFEPDLADNGAGNKTYNFGMTAIIKDNDGVGTDPLYGSVITAGGFESSAATTTTGNSGHLHYTRPAGDTEWASHFSTTTNDPFGVRRSPVTFNDPAAPAQNAVKHYGGVNLLPGLRPAKEEFVYFGGSSCRNFFTDSTLSGCTFDNPGGYYSLKTDLIGSVSNLVNIANTPKRAGMAAARGLDGSGNPIVVAWGGMAQVMITADDPTIYVLYDAGVGSQTDPRWTTKTPTGSVPDELTNAAMVYSHATGKFYLHGGTETTGTASTLTDTWELTVTGACPGACTFSWRKLNVSGGLTCYPHCPAARRSHRMVEVNYNNSAPGTEVKPVTSCTSTAPCSFGIFMEGGSAHDETTFYNDRWMFDPTANNGWGHWQKVDSFPPRRLAAMTSLSYKIAGGITSVHRALMFGGETGMQNPREVAAGSFVPPTLGDTYLFDYQSRTWNRVELLGKGYLGNPATISGLSAWEQRQGYNANSSTKFSELSALTPPPLAGAMMVTRTYPRGLKGQTSPVTPLSIPEVYLFGGRKKDGTLFDLSNVYKFCVGTTGENSSDATCDAYDPDTNPDAAGPTPEFVGRWLKKSADLAGVSGQEKESYLGAAAYDPDHDRVVLFGGIYAGPSTPTITNTAALDASNQILEYTPPSAYTSLDATLVNGKWTQATVCGGSAVPIGRFGHSMGYDPLNHQLVIVGGYDSTGQLLTQTQTTADGSTYTTPEVLTAKRFDSAADVPEELRDSVTGAFPCYYWSSKLTFGNSTSLTSQAPPTTGMGFAAAVFVPSDGYNTGFYSLFDQACIDQGPIVSSDPEISKLNAGGMYFDLDRGKLGPNENLILHLTYLPLGEMHKRPDGEKFTASESAVLKVHLIRNGQIEAALREVLQPRHIAYSDTDGYPQIVQSLAVLAPPTGSVHQDQIVVPISIDSSIDRIRIERVSGSAILIDAAIYRMGYR